MLKHRKLKRLVKYNPITGNVITTCTITLQARGNMRIHIDGHGYKLTDILWFLVHKNLPAPAVIQHVNKCKIDLRLDNLQLDFTKDTREKEYAARDERRRRREEVKQKDIDIENNFKARSGKVDFFDTTKKF